MPRLRLEYGWSMARVWLELAKCQPVLIKATLEYTGEPFFSVLLFCRNLSVLYNEVSF